MRNIKDALRGIGFRPSRQLGQNFLLDPTLHYAIVDSASISPADKVIEIGCGPGFLTAHLLAAGARVLAIEIDSRLIEIARNILPDGVSFFHGDVLAGKNSLDPGVIESIRAHAGSGNCKVVANLPYSVSGPVISLLALSGLPLSSMVFLIQKELADRIVAPRGKQWGPLGFAVALGWEAKYLRTVPPQVFRPRPKVDSALIKLNRLAEPLVEPGDDALAVAAFCRPLFTQKRRTLAAAGKALKLPRWPEVLAGAEIGGGVRVVELAANQLVALFRSNIALIRE